MNEPFMTFQGLLAGLERWSKNVEKVPSPDHQCIRLYTATYRYSISARYPITEGDKGYLGCIASRHSDGKGNDLADGEYNLDTWNRILADIVAYELIPAHETKPSFGTVKDEPPVSDSQSESVS